MAKDVREISSRLVEVSLRGEVLRLLEGEAREKRTSVQEFLRSIVIPTWFQSVDRYRAKRSLLHEINENSLPYLGAAISCLKMGKNGRAISINGGRILLLPVTIVQSIEEWMFKAFGSVAASNILYEIGREVGKNSVRVVNDMGFRFESEEDFRKTREELAPLWGWERLETVEFKPARRFLRSRGTGSAYVGKRNTRSPVCHLGRGFDAGAFEVVSGKKCESIEWSCEGRGDNYCELITGSASIVAEFGESQAIRSHVTVSASRPTPIVT